MATKRQRAALSIISGVAEQWGLNGNRNQTKHRGDRAIRRQTGMIDDHPARTWSLRDLKPHVRDSLTSLDPAGCEEGTAVSALVRSAETSPLLFPVRFPYREI